MICINYDHNKKFGLLKFHSGYGKFNLNSPKGYSLKQINGQTAPMSMSRTPAAWTYIYNKLRAIANGNSKWVDLVAHTHASLKRIKVTNKHMFGPWHFNIHMETVHVYLENLL